MCGSGIANHRAISISPTHAPMHLCTYAPIHHLRTHLPARGSDRFCVPTCGRRPGRGCALGMMRASGGSGTGWQRGVERDSDTQSRRQRQDDKTTRDFGGDSNDKLRQATDKQQTSNRRATDKQRQRQATTSRDSNDYWRGSGPVRRSDRCPGFCDGFNGLSPASPREVPEFVQCASIGFNALQSAGWRWLLAGPDQAMACTIVPNELAAQHI